MKKQTVMGLLMATVLFAGCTTAPEKKAENKSLPVIEAGAAQKTADAFMTQFLAALKAGDCKKLDTALLSESVTKNLTQASFSKYCEGVDKHLGKVINSVYVCDLSNPLYRTFTWKLTMERKSVKPDGKPIIADILFHVQIIRVDDQYKVLNFIINR
jgi:hypothetical protein